MKPGDLVKWKGFGCIEYADAINDMSIIGLVIKVWVSPYNEHDTRVDVLWGPGNFGKGLFIQTVEVIK